MSRSIWHNVTKFNFLLASEIISKIELSVTNTKVSIYTYKQYYIYRTHYSFVTIGVWLQIFCCQLQGKVRVVIIVFGVFVPWVVAWYQLFKMLLYQTNDYARHRKGEESSKFIVGMYFQRLNVCFLEIIVLLSIPFSKNSTE